MATTDLSWTLSGFVLLSSSHSLPRLPGNSRTVLATLSAISRTVGACPLPKLFYFALRSICFCSVRLAEWVCVLPELFGACLDHQCVVVPVTMIGSRRYTPAGSYDSSVHISEEASNAATVVPWAIVWAISIAGILGFGMSSLAFLPLAARSEPLGLQQ